MLYYLLKEVFMDNIDTAILYCLKENGRVTASEISKTVKQSIPAVAERIRKLEQNSIIQKYIIKLDRWQTGQKLLAFIFVNIDKRKSLFVF